MESEDDIRQMLFYCEQNGIKAVVDPEQLQRLLKRLAKAEEAANHWAERAATYKEQAEQGAKMVDDAIIKIATLEAKLLRLRDLCEYWINAGRPGPFPSENEWKTWLAAGFDSNAWRETQLDHEGK